MYVCVRVRVCVVDGGGGKYLRSVAPVINPNFTYLMRLYFYRQEREAGFGCGSSRCSDGENR